MEKATVEVKQRKISGYAKNHLLYFISYFFSAITGIFQDYLFFRKINGWYHWCIYHTCSFNCSDALQAEEFLGHCTVFTEKAQFCEFICKFILILQNNLFRKIKLESLFLLLICARMHGKNFSFCHSLCSNLEEILHDRRRK